MRPNVDPLGKVLLANEALSEELLADVLEQQRRTMPIGSLCYILGHLDEETLARALSRQFGTPGLVLERTVIPLHVLSAVSREVALQHNILPVFEDDQRLFLAAEDPHEVSEVLREIRFVRGKIPVPHVALQVTLARTVRAAYAARDRGERVLAGPLVEPARIDERGLMFVVSELDLTSRDVTVVPVAEAVEDVTKELDSFEMGAMRELDDPTQTVETTALTDELRPITDMHTSPEHHHARSGEITREGTLDSSSDLPDAVMPPSRPPVRAILDLDAGGVDYHSSRGGPRRVLIVDDDFATRHLLVKELQPLGLHTATAATGGEAIRQLKSNPPDVVIMDVMLPEMDGFQICQAIKQSHKYNHIAVLLMSAVISSERVTADILERYGAEGYYEKPIDTELIKRRVREVLRVAGGEKRARADDGFERAITIYKQGDIDGAISVLRAGIEVDPLSPKHHFVLANLLQKKSLTYEAIEEYEATVELKPDYFPALTRLAYLYYKKGFAAKAAAVWERSLNYCTDSALRQNIEDFIATLRTGMQSS